MIPRHSVWLAVLALAACGRDGGGAAGSAARDLPAAREKPDGRAWEALAWAPTSLSAAAEVTILDAAEARAAFLTGDSDKRSEDYVDARRWLVRELGLPEDSASVVLTFREREEDHGRVTRLRVAQVKTSLEDVRRAALAHGGAEAPLDGHPSWRLETIGGTYVTAWAGGWLLRAGVEGVEEIGRAIAAHRGEGSFRNTPGVAEAVAALPDSLPLQCEWGPKFGDFGTLDPVPLGVLTTGSESDARALTSLVFRSAAERAKAHPQFEDLVKRAVAAQKIGSAVFADRGPVLLMAATQIKSPESLLRRARNDLQRIRAAIYDRKAAAAGRFPTTAEGLKILSDSPDGFDQFAGVVPTDPWGHIYHYAFPHPTRPEEFDLRSAGPDGEIDTEDDVFAE